MKRKKCRKALKFQEISAFIYSVTVKDGNIYYHIFVYIETGYFNYFLFCGKSGAGPVKPIQNS